MAATGRSRAGASRLGKLFHPQTRLGNTTPMGSRSAAFRFRFAARFASRKFSSGSASSASPSGSSSSSAPPASPVSPGIDSAGGKGERGRPSALNNATPARPPLPCRNFKNATALGSIPSRARP